MHDVRKGGDVEALKKLWKNIFGDSGADIDVFFKTFFGDSLCMVVEAQKTLASMGFLLPVGFLRAPGKDDTPCGMIYALATEPSKRGLGFGEKITRALIDAAFKRGIGAVVLHPAESSLFEYYSRKSGMKTAFFCKEEKISVSPCEDASLRRISAGEYIAIREEILRDTPHITFDERSFEYQKHLCGDGGLFAGEGCCAVVEAGENVRIVELLGPGENLLSGIAKEFPAGEYLVRRPGGDVRFGMLSAKFSIQSAWYGPAFD